MKNFNKTKGSVTKSLLAGLFAPNPQKPANQKVDTPKPTFGKTLNKQPDLTHDAGNGYNSDLSSIQE